MYWHEAWTHYYALLLASWTQLVSAGKDKVDLLKQHLAVFCPAFPGAVITKSLS